MDFIVIAVLAVGVALLVLGYRKNSRNILLASALLLLAYGVLPDFVAAFNAGLGVP